MLTSTNFRELIVKEIDYAVNRMKQTSDGEEKLYYFSAIPGIIQRVYNLEYDSDLVYMHFILQETYKAFLARFKAIQQGGERIIPLFEEHFEKLATFSKELATRINEKKGIDDMLKKFVLLLYTTTGNGYYLTQKGLLEI